MDLWPPEIIQRILDFSDLKSILNSRLVCAQWRDIAVLNNFVINYATREQVLQVIEQMSKLTHPIGLTFAKTRFKENGPSDQFTELLEISRLTNLTRFIIPDRNYTQFPVENWIRLTTLTNLQQIHIQPAHRSYYSQLLPYLPNITQVDAYDELTVNFLTHLTNLQSLTVSISKPLQNAAILEKLKFPEKLTSLVAFFEGMIDVKQEVVERMTGLKHLEWKNNQGQSFPHHLLPNLESLNVQLATRNGIIPQPSPERLDLNTNLTFLKIRMLADDNPRSHELTVLTKLKSLAIDFTVGREISPMKFLTALTDLENLSLSRRLELHDSLFAPYVTSSKLTELVLNAKTVEFSKEISRLMTLESVAINNGWYMYFLTQLTNLTSLKSVEDVGANAQYQMFLSKLTTLKELSIYRWGDSKFDVNVADLTNLEFLHFATPNPDKGVQGLHSLSKLTYLHFVSNNIDVSCVSKMTDLKYLFVPQRSIGFWNIATQLTNLQQLTVNCDTTDEQALSLLPLTHLTSLVFLKNVSNEVIAKFTHVYQLK